MSSIVIDNGSGVTREKTWVRVALPKEMWAALPDGPVELKNNVMVKSFATNHSGFVHILGDWNPGKQLVELALADCKRREYKYVTSYLLGDALSIMPTFRVMTKDDAIHVTGTPKIELVHSDASVNVFKLWQKAGGMQFHTFLEIYSDEEAVRFSTKVSFNDRSDTSWYKEVKGIWAQSKSYIAVDYRKRRGISPAFLAGDQWTSLWMDECTFFDAEGFDVSGYILPAVKDIARETWRVERLMSYMTPRPPVMGVYSDWQGKFLNFGARFLNVGAKYNFQKFLDFLDQTGDMYDSRPLGQPKSASQSGTQEDFKTCAGYDAIVNLEPMWLYEARYSISELLRPCWYCEDDGEFVQKANHPDWFTHNQVTHVQIRKDNLGKTNERFWPALNYKGQDDQHRSNNLMNAYYALTGDFLVGEMLKCHAQVDAARQDNLNATRASGRLLSSMAAAYVNSGDQTYIQELTRKVNNVKEFRAGKGSDLAKGEWDVVAILHDPRILNGKYKAVQGWEHAVCVTGLFAAQRLGIPGAHELLVSIGKSYLRHMTWKDPQGMWWFTYSIALGDGNNPHVPLQAEHYYHGSERINFHNGEGWWPWHMPAVLAMAEVLSESDPDHARAVEIIRFFVKDVANLRKSTSEWLACVDVKKYLVWPEYFIAF